MTSSNESFLTTQVVISQFTPLVVNNLVLQIGLSLTLDGGTGHSHSVGSAMMELVQSYVFPIPRSLRSGITMSQIRAIHIRKAQIVELQPDDMVVHQIVAC